MAKLIDYLALWVGLIGWCALAAGAEHRKYTEKDDPCFEICREELPIEEKACFMIPVVNKVFRVSLKCAACREMRFCNFGKCRDWSCGRNQKTSTKKPKRTRGSRVGARAGRDFPFRTRRPHNQRPNDHPCDGSGDIPCFVPSPNGNDKWDNWNPDRPNRPNGDDKWDNWNPDRPNRPDGGDNWHPHRTRRPNNGHNDFPWKAREHLHLKNVTNDHLDETKEHDSRGDHKKSRQGSDPICKELPCQANVDPSEHICARVKTKNKKGQPTVVTLRSRKCMEWSNKCEPDAHFHFYQLCHDGDCDQPPEDSLDRCY